MCIKKKYSRHINLTAVQKGLFQSGYYYTMSDRSCNQTLKGNIQLSLEQTSHTSRNYDQYICSHKDLQSTES